MFIQQNIYTSFPVMFETSFCFLVLKNKNCMFNTIVISEILRSTYRKRTFYMQKHHAHMINYSTNM